MIAKGLKKLRNFGIVTVRGGTNTCHMSVAPKKMSYDKECGHACTI